MDLNRSMPGGGALPPRIIAAVGLHGSASTWVFNVMREMVIAMAGQDQLVTLYADTLEALPPQAALAGKHLVVKSHQGSVEMDAWLTAREIPVMMASSRRKMFFFEKKNQKTFIGF